MNLRYLRASISICSLSVFGLFCSEAAATLKIYYDPATGNVAFDTAETVNGELLAYAIGVPERQTSVRFRHENLIRLSTSNLFTQRDISIGDSTQGTPWRGLYTIGDVLPIGLTEEFWTNTFVNVGSPDEFAFYYLEELGGGIPPGAEFIYGPPDGEFVNRWDLIDPDTLTWASTAKLVYRAWSGEVLIDTTDSTSGYISMFLLKSNGAFLPDGFTPFAEGPYRTANADTIFQAADAVEPGRYSIGHILPANLSEQEFEATFTNAQFLARAGFDGGSFDFEVDGIAMSLQYVAVPEPSAIAWVGFASLVIGIRRSRLRPAMATRR